MIKLNFSDEWNTVGYLKINIGDSWKDIRRAYINIGDSWKQFMFYVPTRAVSAGGNGYVNPIDYINIVSINDGADFGNLTVGRYVMGAVSNATNDRACFCGGANVTNVIDYITVSSTGNATNFGDLTVAKFYVPTMDNTTNERGVIGQGSGSGVDVNVIDYITINSAGNASDFGDISFFRYYSSGTSNSINERGIIYAGFDSPTRYNNIDYITINSPSSSTDFGDAIEAIYATAGASNGTNERGVFFGGNGLSASRVNTIAYITINSLGNANDFGDLTAKIEAPEGGTSNLAGERAFLLSGYLVTSYSKQVECFTINSLGNAFDFGDLNVIYWGRAASNGNS